MLAREDHGLDGKVAIVTGGGSRDEGIGNGRAAAILLARAGCKVLVVDREPDAAEATVAMINGEGGEASGFAADVTRDGGCKAMVAAAVERYGRLDVLDNNVGISGRGSVVDFPQADWENVMRVNVTAIDGPPTRERGGRRRRFFRVTPTGLAALTEMERVRQTLRQGVPQLAMG